MNTTCRFCNAVLDDAGQCPRCGESDPAGGGRQPPVASRVASSQQGADAPRSPSSRRSNLRTGLLVLGGMVVLFAAALIFMLSTRGKRGGRSLAEAPALGYLPADTNAI